MTITITNTMPTTTDNDAAIALGCQVHLRRDHGEWAQVRYLDDGSRRSIMRPRTVQVMRYLDAIESGAADAWIDRDVSREGTMPALLTRLIW